MTQSILALFIAASFVATIGLIAFWQPPNNDLVIGMINTAVGALGALATTVVTYYFGSSSGSKAKDETLGKIAEGPPQPTPNDSNIEG